MATIPRESAEILDVDVYFAGQQVTDGYELAVTSGYDDRPTTWAPPVVAGEHSGVTTAGRSPGHYRVWARQTNGAAPYATVEQVGSFRIT